ncbi:MAG: hypothetical protein ACTSRA_19430 [Promethearchaeota archaeon]
MDAITNLKIELRNKLRDIIDPKNECKDRGRKIIIGKLREKSLVFRPEKEINTESSICDCIILIFEPEYLVLVIIELKGKSPDVKKVHSQLSACIEFFQERILPNYDAYKIYFHPILLSFLLHCLELKKDTYFHKI